jgi:uncharacterized protein (TIGR03086 family)
VNPNALLASATQATEGVVSRIKPDQMGDNTPCHEWDVKTLLNHLVAVNAFFGSVLGGTIPDQAAFFQEDHLGDDAAGAYAASAERLHTAFAAPGASEQIFDLPGFPAPGSALLGITVSDNLVHGWDLAKATGQTLEVDDQVAEETLGMVRSTNVAAKARGTAFAEEVTAADGASPLDRLVSFLGRQP